MKLFSWLFVIPSWTTRNAAQSCFPIDIWIQGYKNLVRVDRTSLASTSRPPWAVQDRPIHLRKRNIPTANRDSFFQILRVCLSNEKTE